MSTPDVLSRGAIEHDNHEADYWFVMRDLKRANAKLPAYMMLGDMGFEVFVPMKWQLAIRRGKRIREQVPFLRDLLFVHATRGKLDPIVDKTDTLQYRYIRGGKYRDPMKVGSKEMERFIQAVRWSENPVYYLPDEIPASMYGRKVCIIGGDLDGHEGTLLKVRGLHKKRILVELPHLLSASVDLEPEFVRFVEE